MKNIVLISGSHRKNSESRRIVNYLATRCQALLDCRTHVLDMAELRLPLWDEQVWQGGEPWKSILPPVHEVLAKADGLLVIAPEWGGMVPPGLKNLLLQQNSVSARSTHHSQLC